MSGSDSHWRQASPTLSVINVIHTACSMSALRRWSVTLTFGPMLVAVACEGTGTSAISSTQTPSAPSAKIASTPPLPVPPGVVPLPTSPPPTPTPDPNCRSDTLSEICQGRQGHRRDTFNVEFEDGTTDTVRLLGIDTPETQIPNAPNEYGLITDTTCLRRWGQLATEFASITQGQTVTLTLDREAGERGRFGRLLAYIEFAGQDFGATLVTLGFARVYAEGEATREPDYLELESIAREEGKGLWGSANQNLANRHQPRLRSVALRHHPRSDPHRFDGDGDGVGCES